MAARIITSLGKIARAKSARILGATPCSVTSIGHRISFFFGGSASVFHIRFHISENADGNRVLVRPSGLAIRRARWSRVTIRQIAILKDFQ
jgi:hypothetical protein